MRKQLTLCLTTSATLRSVWDRLPERDREQLIGLLAGTLARAANSESYVEGREEKHEGVSR
jgi:hypothetical protein